MQRPIFRLSEAISRNKLISYAETWRQIAGPALLKVSEFRGVSMIKDKLTLCLVISDPVWRQELFHQRRDLLSSYRKILKERGLAETDIPSAIQFRAL
ncbi:DUF721 domain-containing protein [bacterium]|nr:DUF721 domain-containing protein [bacterium]